MNTRRILALLVAFATVVSVRAAEDLGPIKQEVTKRHDEALKRLQDWIKLPSIAAEDLGYPAGAEYMAKLAKEAGFQQATVMNTDGKPGVFATLDAGAKKTVGLYFMYDVKQFDPKEWTSPPLDAALVDKPGLGKAIVGRGAVNHKGPESAFLAALHAIKGAGKKMPVNLVMVAEGEEEIGSPHIAQIVRKPEVQAALAKTVGVFMPSSMQDLDGVVTVSLGAKGVVELELVSTGEKWGRGPGKDVHSSNEENIDIPSWHLVQALHTLAAAGHPPEIDGFLDKVRPLSSEQRRILETAIPKKSEALAKKGLGVTRWVK